MCWGDEMNEKFIRDRITQLRIRKEISEYKMSLDLGHSKSYIQSIANGRALPSMSEFLYICDYLGVTPQEFFDEELPTPQLSHELTKLTSGMDREDMEVLIAMAKRIRAK